MRKLILAGMLLIGSVCHADDLMVSGGAAYKRGSTHAESVTYQDEFREVKYLGNLKYEVSLLNIGNSEVWSEDQPDKQTLVGRFVRGFRNDQIEIGLGLSYSTTSDRYNGSRLNFTEVFRFNFEKGYFLEVIHISNAGIVKPNLGRDTVMFGRKL